MGRIEKRCPNPPCGFRTADLSLEKCPRCGVPLVEDREGMSGRDFPAGAIKAAVIILAIVVAIAGAYFYYEKAGETVPLFEPAENGPIPSGHEIENREKPELGPANLEQEPPGEDSIMIGVVYGRVQEGDDEDVYLKAAWMKADEINDSGGIRGKPLWIDSVREGIYRSDYDSTADYFSTHAGIVAVIGYVNYINLGRDLETYESRELPLVSAVTLNSGFGRDREWVFIADVTETDEGRFLAKYIKNGLQARTVAVLFGAGPYYARVESEFVTTAKEIGLTVAAEIPLVPNTADFRSPLEEIKNLSPDCTVILGCYDRATWILSQARELGVTTRFIGDTGCGILSDTAINDPAVQGLLTIDTVFPDWALHNTDDFEKNFRERYGSDPDPVCARFYDLVGLVAEAIDAVGPDREAVRDYLASLNTFEKGYRGTTGVLVFDEHGDLVLPVYVVEIQNGKYVLATKQLFPDVAGFLHKTADP